MSSIARWLHAQGARVYGYDRTPTALTQQLIQEGIDVCFDTDEQHIPQEMLAHKAQSLVIYTPAIPQQHPLLQYFNTHGYRVCKRIEVLTMLTQRYKTVAVAGTHGKTATTSLLAHILYQAQRNMVAFVGGVMKGYNTNLLMHNADHEDALIVIEADEYDRFFLHLHPDIGIVTTMDADHLDIYGTPQQYQAAFRQFIGAIPNDEGHAIIHQKVAQQLGLDHTSMPHATYYALENAGVRAENIRIVQGYFYFDYVSDTVRIDHIQLPVPGYFSIENTLAAITACLLLGLDAQAILAGIHTFQGVERRFEYVLNDEHTVFINDYAHHPVEIAASLRTARALYPKKHITVIFQPHLYTRTHDFASTFAQSLDLADRVYLLDIYPAREAPIAGVTTALIADQMKTAEKILCTPDTLLAQWAHWDRPEVLMTIGAGDIHDLVPALATRLQPKGV